MSQAFQKMQGGEPHFLELGYSPVLFSVCSVMTRVSSFIAYSSLEYLHLYTFLTIWLVSINFVVHLLTTFYNFSLLSAEIYQYKKILFANHTKGTL